MQSKLIRLQERLIMFDTNAETIPWSVVVYIRSRQPKHQDHTTQRQEGRGRWRYRTPYLTAFQPESSQATSIIPHEHTNGSLLFLPPTYSSGHLRRFNMLEWPIRCDSTSDSELLSRSMLKECSRLPWGHCEGSQSFHAVSSDDSYL